MKDNIHDRAIPQDILMRAQTKIQEALTELSPYLLALTPEDRREMPKMGEKTVAFVEKAFDFAKQNPKLVPSYLEMAEFEIDFQDAHGLWALHNMIIQLEEGISGTEMAAGSEAYQAALVFYQSAKAAAAQNVSGANAVYDELKKRFPQGKRRSAEGAQAPLS
jgi:hypothetical protein